jgi:hypothetical protein
LALEGLIPDKNQHSAQINTWLSWRCIIADILFISATPHSGQQQKTKEKPRHLCWHGGCSPPRHPPYGGLCRETNSVTTVLAGTATGG